jgi:type I restriction enzyme S subunit
MRRYDSYIDSGIEVLGKVPSSWKKSKFKFQHFEQDERVGEDSTEYDLLSLTKKGIILRDIESGKGKFPESFDTYKKVKKDDLIFCLYDIEETPRTVGLSELNGMITGSYKIFNSKDVITKFTYYTFLIIDDVKGLKPYYTGLRNVVRPETFKSLPFFIPPLHEQQQIVSFLDTKTSLIDSLIEKTQQKIELLKEKRTSLINEVVTKGLNPNVEMKDSGVEWIGEIPSGWFCVGTNKVYHDLGTGTTPTSDNTEYYDEVEGNHWITTTDLNEGIMYDTLTKITDKSLEDYPNLRLYPSGSIYISMYGGRIGKLGVSTFESYCNQSVCVLPKNEKINVKFYYYWFLGFQDFVKNMGRGGGQPNINKDMIKQFPTVKIPLSEQNEIVSYLDEQTGLIDKTISVEERRIELLKEYRQSLISEVVTGKRKVV